MTQSITRSIIRSFLSALFSVLGFLAGIFLIIALLGAMLKDKKDGLEAKSYYSPTIVANADKERTAASDNAPVILKLSISGLIGTESLNMNTVSQILQESREGLFKNDRVKAVLVQISSPGGTVVDSDGIYRALKQYKKDYNVPIYGFVDGLCASGGMYIASACDKVYATDVSLIGSVGVLSPAFFNFTELMEKVGVDAKVLSAGKGKDALNPLRPWKEGEADSLKAIIDSYYNQFVDIVVENRPDIKRTHLINDYGAHVYLASKAQELGYIDGSGFTYEETMKLLAKEMGIEDDYYQVVRMERKFDLSDYFNNGTMLFNGRVKHQIDLSPSFDLNLMNQYLYLYMP